MDDRDRRIRECLAEGPTVLPEPTYAVIRAVIEQTSQRVPVGPVMAPLANQALRASMAAAALVTIALVGVTLLPAGGSGGPAASASPTPTIRPATLVGLPPEGTTPSDPAAGKLALQVEGSHVAAMWVYDDGRLITSSSDVRPDDPDDAYLGLSMQRLTPAGVEFLRSAIIRTGMFEEDFLLARGVAQSLQIGVRNGDEFVRGQWAGRLIAGDAPTAAPDEEGELLALSALLGDQATWPPTSWADPVPKAYVPSEYAICFGVRLRAAAPGVWVGSFEQSRVLALLPQPARDVLRAGTRMRDTSGWHADAGCLLVTTDAARVVARTLDDAGVTRATAGLSSYWLGYELKDPRLPEHEIWIQFGPSLPHGEGVWLGPG